MRSMYRWSSSIPVIVGKRALPALDLSMLFGPWLKRSSGRKTSSWASGRPKAMPKSQPRSTEAQRRGAMTFALPGPRRATTAVRPPQRGIPSSIRKMIEILYHTLWETVHVFFEHREMGFDIGEAGFLYPFLGAKNKQTTGDVVAEVAASIRLKVQEDTKLRIAGGRRGSRAPSPMPREPSANAWHRAAS